LKPGDLVSAYQTDRNQLVGLLRFEHHKNGGAYFVVNEKLGVKVRPLKKSDERIEVIPALQQGPVRALFGLSDSDGQALLVAARKAKARKEDA
jgi:hypothetical protein